MMDLAFLRRALPRFLFASALSIATLTGLATTSSAQTPPPPPQQDKSGQVDPKNPAAPTSKMESPEVPKPQGDKGPLKEKTGTPQPPEQPYPSKTKDK
jgi:hypothetical protein